MSASFGETFALREHETLFLGAILGLPALLHRAGNVVVALVSC